MREPGLGFCLSQSTVLRPSLPCTIVNATKLHDVSWRMPTSPILWAIWHPAGPDIYCQPWKLVLKIPLGLAGLKCWRPAQLTPPPPLLHTIAGPRRAPPLPYA